MTKHPIALRLGWQECKNYLLLHSSFTFILKCSVFPIQSLDVCSKTRLVRNTKCEIVRGANATGCVRLAWRKRPRKTSREELHARLENVLLGLKSFFNIFSVKFFKNLNLCTSYIKQIMNVFSFVQWNKYFHSVKDELYHWTRLRLVEWNISSFTSWKYLYHCTHKHSLFVYYYMAKKETRWYHGIKQIFGGWLNLLPFGALETATIFPWAFGPRENSSGLQSTSGK